MTTSAPLPYTPPTCDAEAAGERLTTADEIWGPTGAGHVARYRLAAGYVQRGDVVLDAACGVGYAATILAPSLSRVTYVGVDRRAPDTGWPTFRPIDALRVFVNADLADPDWSACVSQEIQRYQPVDGVDVAISFETIEHLADPAPLIGGLLQARRYVVASVPVGPTTGENPWHLTDWEPGQLADTLLGHPAAGAGDWVHVATWPQPDERAEVVVLANRWGCPELATWP